MQNVYSVVVDVITQNKHIVCWLGWRLALCVRMINIGLAIGRLEPTPLQFSHSVHQLTLGYLLPIHNIHPTDASLALCNGLWWSWCSRQCALCRLQDVSFFPYKIISSMHCNNLWLFCSCRKWVINSRRADLDKKTPEQLNRSFYLCSEHFEHSQFTNDLRNRLKWNALPTLFNVSPVHIISVFAMHTCNVQMLPYCISI